MANAEAQAAPAPRTSHGELLSKVPQVTVFFWIIKVLCTTVGETASDFLNINMGLGLHGTSIAAGVLLAVVLFLQFRAKKYIPGIYWLTVVLISVFGTLVTDILTDSLKFPLEASTLIFSVALGITFFVWYSKEKTLSIHSVYTTRREAFYWLAILFTFALGTATGDLVAEKLGFGYLTTGLIVLGVIAASGIGWKLGLDSVLAFWIAYILTRPLGASVGDYLSQSKANGGLGLGATITSVIFLGAILAVVVYLAISKRDTIPDPTTPSPSERVGPTAKRQLIAVLAVLFVASGVGYYVRTSQLRKEAAATVTADKPLGDLSSYRTITQDMSKLVKAGDWEGARSRADDIETAWDNGQSRMQPLNPDKWTEMDAAIDAVLKSVRSKKQDAAAAGAALDNLLKVIDSLDKPK